jgi:SAM-dependent methyltransferase
MDTFTEVLSILSQRIPGFAEAIRNELQGFDSWSCMPSERYRGKDLLDLGCGIGAASALFVERGANFVWGIDPVLTDEQIDILGILPRSRFTSCPLSKDVFGGKRFDLVYARLVTEHIMDLPAAFSTVCDLLHPGGRFVGLHDNYYSPMGAHDQGFIGPVGSQSCTFHSRAISCWKSRKKCQASAEFRKEIEQEYDWTIKTWTLTPHDCSRCTYFRRAQLWGHLLYQGSFNQVYPGTFFKTNLTGGLNKVTPFQLRQFLIETGFKVTTWIPVMVTNKPPRRLTRLFNESDLRTLTILFAADKLVLVNESASSGM